MKKPFTRNNSIALLSLLIFITILFIRSGNYSYIVNIIFFGVLFFYYRKVLTAHTLGYFFIIGVLTFWGIIHSNSYISIIEDIMIFSPFFLLIMERKTIRMDLKTTLPEFLANSLIVLIPFSFLIFFYMDYGIGSLESGRFNYNKEIKFEYFAPITPIIFAPYLIFFFDTYNKKQKLLVHISMILIGLMGIITLSKSVILGAIIPYLIFYGYKIISISSYARIKYLSLISILILVSSQFGGFKKIQIADVVLDVIERTSRQSEEGTLSTGRFEEMVAYFNQDLDFLEYVIGRGLGGHKVRNDSDFYIGGVSMMHFGPVHVFLKGGILLVIAMYLPFILAFFKFWKTPDYPISLIVVFFLIANLQTSNWSWQFHTFFYWYGISMYFLSNKTIKPTTIK